MAVSCHNGPPRIINYPPQDISKIDIKYVSANIETPIAVTCENFETGWKDKRHIMVDDTATIAKIMYYIDKAPVDTARLGLDVRRQLKIYWNNRPVESICMDGGSFQRNGKLYIYTDDLTDVIEGMLPESDRYFGYAIRDGK